MNGHDARYPGVFATQEADTIRRLSQFRHSHRNDASRIVPRPWLTLSDALLDGPGLDGYVYDAAAYCVDCGQDITREVFARFPEGIPYPDAQDSETVPQPIFFGDSPDNAQHCDCCGAYLYGGEDAR